MRIQTLMERLWNAVEINADIYIYIRDAEGALRLLRDDDIEIDDDGDIVINPHAQSL